MVTVQRFELCPEHILLLRNAYVSWHDAETGAPSIDPKRPYGNSDVEGDVLNLLKEFPDDPGDETREAQFTEAQLRKAAKLHKETEMALQVVLSTGCFEPGVYEAERYTRDWKKVAELAATGA